MFLVLLLQFLRSTAWCFCRSVLCFYKLYLSTLVLGGGHYYSGNYFICFVISPRFWDAKEIGTRQDGSGRDILNSTASTTGTGHGYGGVQYSMDRWTVCRGRLVSWWKGWAFRSSSWALLIPPFLQYFSVSSAPLYGWVLSLGVLERMEWLTCLWNDGWMNGWMDGWFGSGFGPAACFFGAFFVWLF